MSIADKLTPNEAADLLSQDKEEPEFVDDETWDEDPIPFNERDLPKFPLSALPGWLKDMAVNVAVFTQTPVDLAAMLILAVIILCITKKFTIRMREGWFEQLCLYVAVALNSGERKSPVFNIITETVEEFEREQVELTAPLVAEAQSKKRIMEERLKLLQSKASKDDNEKAIEYQKEASELAKELQEFKIPVLPRMIVDDATPEIVATRLAQNDGKLALLSTEGAIFEIMSGRYSQTGFNIEVFLRAYSGDTIRVDRVGRPPEYVKKPALTIGLTVQPEVIEGLFDKPGFRGRGLIPRFLFALPNSMVGFRDTCPPPMPRSVISEYNSNIRKILQMESAVNSKNEFTPHILMLSPGAERRSNEFAKWLEPQLQEAGELYLVRDFCSKIHGNIGRIAALLHVAVNVNRRPQEEKVSEHAFEAAIEIGKYCINHARIAYEEMGADLNMNDAKYLLCLIQKDNKKSYPRQELWQRTRGKFKTTEKMDAAIKILIEHNCIKEKQDTGQEGPGRKRGPDYLVNPKLTWSQEY